MNDYRRPADYQINEIYRCSDCGGEIEVSSVYAAPLSCGCGGRYQLSGESYPADSQDWHEERDNVNDDFRNPYRRY